MVSNANGFGAVRRVFELDACRFVGEHVHDAFVGECVEKRFIGREARAHKRLVVGLVGDEFAQHAAVGGHHVHRGAAIDDEHATGVGQCQHLLDGGVREAVGLGWQLEVGRALRCFRVPHAHRGVAATGHHRTAVVDEARAIYKCRVSSKHF